MRFARVCRKDGEEIPYDQIVKGYEYQDGDYMVLSDEDIENASQEKYKTIDIKQFAAESDTDSRYFEKPYYLEPSKGAEKTDALLREALIESKKGKETSMPQNNWSEKREHQYKHIEEGLEKRGHSKQIAEEIAARTVSKERARAGEARTSSKTSRKDISPGRRGGLRSHSGSQGRTKEQLYKEAQKKNIKGRSTMTKGELEKALGR